MIWVLLIMLSSISHISMPHIYVTQTKKNCLKLRQELFEDYKRAQGYNSKITLTSNHGMSKKFRCVLAMQVKE